MSDFLLELGTEEIPDWMIEGALADLERLFNQFVTNNNLLSPVAPGELRPSGSVKTAATPRRLVLKATDLLEAQPDEVKLLTGPAKGVPDKAIEGFARKSGVPVDQLVLLATDKGEYWSYSKKVTGRAAKDLLAEALPNIIAGIQWPKTMYWTGKGGPRFIRPIRWIVSLLGGEVVPFKFAGVPSGNVTRGHRRLGAAEIPVTVATYDEALAKNFVILDSSKRREKIESNLGPGVKKDEALVHTLVYLTEYPTPIRGSFDPSYLELPEEILSTVMRHHQRYFTVEEKGHMAPAFVAVMNTDADPEGLVRHGNERVLRARFNDARFFFTKDQERPLAGRVEDLKAVTFQARLGNYYEKTRRNIALARELAKAVGASEEFCSRAAQLAKADLTTEMVKEFTELQGVVGGLYARKQGEPEEVAQAVYEHYKPVSMEDSIPSTLTGQVVALADKLDTLEQFFKIGLVPTGSKDPFAIRRSAQGVVRILVETNVSIAEHFVLMQEDLRDFLLDRCRYYLREVRGFKYDEVNAVVRTFADPAEDYRRLLAIQAVRPTPHFEPLAASFKRIQNIIRQAQFTPDSDVNPALLEAGPEADLYRESQRIRAEVTGHQLNQDYRSALEAIASLRPHIDRFFDKVLVNAPDQDVRRNRLTLLSNLLTELSVIADFSEIVTSS